VHTIERIPELAESAKQRLARLGYENVTIHVGDGTLGLPEHAPYDAICVTAGGTELPPAYQGQLAEGGRILIPLGESGHQTMYRFTRRGERLVKESLGTFAFVPLIGGTGGD
jgi:protein-L-isoaspartate(D-aspartate) O-methyltransferase